MAECGRLRYLQVNLPGNGGVLRDPCISITNLDSQCLSSELNGGAKSLCPLRFLSTSLCKWASSDDGRRKDFLETHFRQDKLGFRA